MPREASNWSFALRTSPLEGHMLAGWPHRVRYYARRRVIPVLHRSLVGWVDLVYNISGFGIIRRPAFRSRSTFRLLPKRIKLTSHTIKCSPLEFKLPQQSASRFNREPSLPKAVWSRHYTTHLTNTRSGQVLMQSYGVFSLLRLGLRRSPQKL